MIPLLGVYLSPMLDLWLSGFQKFGWPPRNYVVTMLLGGMGLRALRSRSWSLGIANGGKPLVQVVLALFTWMVFSSLVQGLSLDEEIEVETLYMILGRVCMGLVLALMTQHFVRTPSQIWTFIGFIVGSSLLSAVIAIMQYYDFAWAWEMRWNLAPPEESDAILLGAGANPDRVMGLAGFSIDFGFHLVNTVPLTLGMLIMQSQKIRKGKRLSQVSLWCAFLIMGWAVVISGTRATLIGGGLAILLLLRQVYFTDKSWLNRMGGVLAIATVVVLSVEMTKGGEHAYRWESWYFSETSQAARLPSLIFGIEEGLQHPLGVGFQRGYAVFHEYPVFEGLHLDSPHNHLVNQLVAWGIPGLLLTVLYYIRLFGLVRSLNKNSPDHFLNGIAITLKGGFLGELIYAQVHNGGPFNGDIMHWYLVGLLLAVVRLRENSSGSPLYQ